MRGTLSDVNHFVADVSGFIEILIPPPRYVTLGMVDGTRLAPLATYTPSASSTPTATPTPACSGDCDRDGRTTIAEVIAGVHCALSMVHALEPPCPCLDRDGNGTVTANEIVGPLHSVLHGCPQ